MGWIVGTAARVSAPHRKFFSSLVMSVSMNACNATEHSKNSWRCRLGKAASTGSFDFAERSLRASLGFAQDDSWLGRGCPGGFSSGSLS